MKFNTRQTLGFLTKPDPSVRVILFYGSDQGLIHERTQTLIKEIVEDPKDPFRVSCLTGAGIKKNPTQLFDEATAQSLIGGDRVVVIDLGAEDISKSIEQCLENAKCSLIIIEAGGLGPKSPVRKVVEKSKNAAAVPGYLDNSTELHKLIDAVMQSNDTSISPEGKRHLIDNLGSDRLVSRSELEKLVTYVGQKAKVTLDDVLAIVGDNGAFSLDKIIYPVGNGNHSEIEPNLERAFKEGLTSVAVLRATMRHFHKLHLALSYIEKGQSPGDALRFIKPPIMYLFKDQFIKQLERWPKHKVERALVLLNEAEILCKTTGLPINAICGRALMSLAQMVRK